MSTSIDAQKRSAAEAAAALIQPGMVVGLGTGTTTAWFVKALAARNLDIVGVATSKATEDLAISLGISVVSFDDAAKIDLTVDGADEIGPGLGLIKGGGAALLREKLVWEASRRCIVIADAAKSVPVLGQFPLPIEIVPFGHATTAVRVRDALADCNIKTVPILRLRDGQPLRTDNGNLIYDAACGVIRDPSSLADALKSVTGVVDHGLFLDLADEALVGSDGTVLRLLP
jgi:ribose 5-phosphate isomerase A